MKQSGSLHAAVIMDGNGRWAEGRGLPRTAGHRAGARAVERLVEAAPSHGIATLTLYAFSSDNWSRPMPEVTALMRLLRGYLRAERDRAVANGVALEVVGRRDRLPAAVVREIEATERATAAGTTLRVRLAIDYSARDAIMRAALRWAAEAGEAGEGGEGPAPELRERFAALLAQVDHGARAAPPVDLLIRTGGEHRLSDFLLWESAYAELFFLDVMWPEFTPADLADVVRRFNARERRFGGLARRAPRPPISLSR